MSVWIRPLEENDRYWAEELLRNSWGALQIVTTGRIHDAGRLPGLVAVRHGSKVGLLIYGILEETCEIVTLNSLAERKGVATMLIDTLASISMKEGCTRLLLCTTNDNTYAMKFYQKRGFHISAVNLDIMKHYRTLKPSIPQMGYDGIPIRDEVVFERTL